MATRQQKNYLMFGALGLGAYVLYRNSKGLAPIPTSVQDALTFPSQSVLPPVITTTPVYNPQYSPPPIPAGTPEDVKVCFARKSGNGWTLEMCATRLAALKSAYAAAKANSGNAGDAAGIAAANAKIAQLDDAIRSHTNALNAEADPARRAIWQNAINGFLAERNVAVGEVARATVAGGGEWANAAKGHAADYFALTGIALN